MSIKTRFRTSAKPMWQSSLLLIVITLLCLPFLQFDLADTQPFNELLSMFNGLVHANFNIEGIFEALLYTVVFAIQAVVISIVLGFFIAQAYRLPGVRPLMTALRSVHELFWALILIQLFGLTTLTGVLAIVIPFTATFARVFAEIQQETPKHIYHQLNGTHFSRLIYSTLPLAWPRLSSYCRYRLECALRASVVLGFIGLPTLGYKLDAYLKLGQYPEVFALILVFIALVLSMKLWVNRFTILGLFVLSVCYLPPTYLPSTIESSSSTNLNVSTELSSTSINSDEMSARFQQFFNDITPAPIKSNNTDSFPLHALWEWLCSLFNTQIFPGIMYTLLLGQFALALSAFCALLCFPLLSKHFIKLKPLHRFNTFIMTSIRCLPELLLAFIALIILGPSLLPGILALGIHNGVLLAHLTALHCDEQVLRNDRYTHLNLYCFEILPRIYGQFIAFTLYRGETILRETAILGILGITTLGFYIDSAFEEFRLDRAFVLIIVSAILNIFAEALATYCRKYIHSYTNNEAITSYNASKYPGINL